LHDIAGHQIAHRDFKHPGPGTVLFAAQYGGRGADHGLERFGGFGRAVLLPEPQHAAEADHQPDDDDFGQVAFFTVTQRNPVVGEKADHRQGQQDVDERVMQCQQELHDRVGRLVVGRLVVTLQLQAFRGLEQGQAVGGGLDVRQGRRQSVLCFTCGTHGQFCTVCSAVFIQCFGGFQCAHRGLLLSPVLIRTYMRLAFLEANSSRPVRKSAIGLNKF